MKPLLYQQPVMYARSGNA